MENQTEKIWTGLKNKFSVYVKLKWHLWKLMAIERAAGMLSSLSHALILLFLLFFSLLFLFVSLGFFLGEWMGSFAWGFFSVSLLYLLLAYLLVLNKENLCLRMENVFVKLLQSTNQKNDENEGQAAVDTARTVVGGAETTEDPLREPGTPDTNGTT